MPHRLYNASTGMLHNVVYIIAKLQWHKCHTWTNTLCDSLMSLKHIFLFIRLTHFCNISLLMLLDHG